MGSEGFCRSIVVSLDGSPISEQIFPYVTILARRCSAVVTLVHVVDDSAINELSAWQNLPSVKALVDRDMERAGTYLADFRGRLESAGIATSTEVILGSPAKAIVDLAQRTGADVIAMSTRGRGGLIRQVLGSVAEKVVRTAATPVLLYHPQGTSMPTAAIDHLLVPLDGSALAEKVLPIVEQAATSLKVPVTLFRAIAGYTFSFPVPMPDGAAETSTQILEAIAKDAVEYLSNQATALKAKGLEAVYRHAVGDPSEDLVKAADEVPASIIVMSTHGRGGMARAVLGSVADKVMRSSGRPVLLVPSQA